jgi:muconolactone delta-isomerase
LTSPDDGCPAETAARRFRADDIAFARELDKKSVMHWSHAWPRIGELQRAGLLRVRPINRWVAETEAIGPAASKA